MGDHMKKIIVLFISFVIAITLSGCVHKEEKKRIVKVEITNENWDTYLEFSERCYIQLINEEGLPKLLRVGNVLTLKRKYLDLFVDDAKANIDNSKILLTTRSFDRTLVYCDYNWESGEYVIRDYDQPIEDVIGLNGETVKMNDTYEIRTNLFNHDLLGFKNQSFNSYQLLDGPYMVDYSYNYGQNTLTSLQASYKNIEILDIEGYLYFYEE